MKRLLSIWGLGARGKLQVRGGLGEATAPQEADLSAATHVPRGTGSLSNCPILASSFMSAPDKQGCTPLLQGHWPFQIWTRTGQKSFKPLLFLFFGLCHIYV